MVVQSHFCHPAPSGKVLSYLDEGVRAVPAAGEARVLRHVVATREQRVSWQQPPRVFVYTKLRKHPHLVLFLHGCSSVHLQLFEDT